MNKHSRSKSGLFLMEMIIVILFFSLSSAICMKIFSTSKIKSDHSRDISNASVKAQSCAEAYKAYSADLQKVASTLDGTPLKEKMVVYYDFNWQEVESKDDASYILTLKNSDDKYKSTGKIAVEKKDGKILFELNVKVAKPN